MFSRRTLFEKSSLLQGRLLQGYAWHLCHVSGCHRHPLLFPTHHQHLWIVPFFSLSASTALWYAKILIAVLSFSPRSACKHSAIHFYLGPRPSGQPSVTQPCQNRRNRGSTGAQHAEEGDKEGGFSLWLLSKTPLLTSSP